MTNAIELNDVNFEKEVKKSSVPVLVDFFATWCGPCRKQLPVVDDLAREFAGKARIGKINVDQNRKTAAEYTINSIPALLVFKEGRVIEKLAGLHTHEQLVSVLKKYL